ncbi:cytochrome P450 [Erythrobacter westpacificensis]|uniref:Cytochrome P450 n=1 Tax=Erythrobacter westpacificensis TaxID=1055231 RepID=A0ABP9KUC2_9SPHN
MQTENSDARPLFKEFAPFSKEQLADPNCVLARARKDVPVFYSPEFDFWVVTRYEDVNRIFGEPKSYSSSSVLAPRSDRPAEIVREFGDRELGFQHQLVMSDPPAHSRLKKLMSPAFLPRRVLAREQWLRDFTNGLIDKFEQDRKVDLVSQYTAPIPVATIAKVVGAPEEDAKHFSGWVNDILTLTGSFDTPEAELISAWRGIFAFEDYVRALIAERRETPQDDLTSDFIQARSDDGSPAMNDTEVVWNVFNIVGAGTDSTGVLLSHVFHLLLTSPEKWDAVCADKSLIPNMIEEALRVRSPVRGLLRKTTEAVTINDVSIPADALVYTHIASANQDDAVFENPDEFDICRAKANRHLGFGSRNHACIGAPLARLEAKVAVETLVDRLPGLKIVDDSRELEYRPNLLLPAIAYLNARW